jgi:endonuclease/exonuclease/phosphatase family metal-dependent hydrolase
MRRRFLALPLALFLLLTIFTATPAHAAAPPLPSGIATLVARPGPGVGELTFTWTHDGRNTTSYLMETGLTTFSKTDATFPLHGRGAAYFPISKSVRSYTLTAAQLVQASARVSSGNHVLFRMAAVNRDSQGVTSMRYYPYLQGQTPRPQAPMSSYGKLRVASFNVRTARALEDSRTWLERAPDVAKQIMAYKPGVVALQELGPGRADGQLGSLVGQRRQTESLTDALDRFYGERYDLVRTTAYVGPGIPTNTQGARILYDRNRYSLLSSCPELTGTSQYSGSCTIRLPLRYADSEDFRRRAAYALFEEKTTGYRFYFASVHLDSRRGATVAEELSLEALRKSQSDTVSAAVEAMNTRNYPIIIGGDFNTWQNNKNGNNSAHDTLVAQGYYDTVAAVVRKNYEYTTVNHYEPVLLPAGQGNGVRLDMIFLKGGRGASYYENVMKPSDTQRASDHNMIVTDIAPFDPYRSVSSDGSVRRPPRRPSY